MTTDAIPEWWFVGPSVRGQSSVVKEAVMPSAIVDATTRSLVGEQCRLAQEALAHNNRSEAIARLHYAELLAGCGSPDTIVGMSAVLRMSGQHEDNDTR